MLVAVSPSATSLVEVFVAGAISRIVVRLVASAAAAADAWLCGTDVEVVSAAVAVSPPLPSSFCERKSTSDPHTAKSANHSTRAAPRREPELPSRRTGLAAGADGMRSGASAEILRRLA